MSPLATSAVPRARAHSRHSRNMSNQQTGQDRALLVGEVRSYRVLKTRETGLPSQLQSMAQKFWDREAEPGQGGQPGAWSPALPCGEVRPKAEYPGCLSAALGTQAPTSAPSCHHILSASPRGAFPAPTGERLPHSTFADHYLVLPEVPRIPWGSPQQHWSFPFSLSTNTKGTSRDCRTHGVANGLSTDIAPRTRSHQKIQQNLRPQHSYAFSVPSIFYMNIYYLGDSTVALRGKAATYNTCIPLAR